MDDGEQKFVAEIQEEFLAESCGFLEQTEKRFLELEKNPNDKRIIEDILRMAHNIKGSAAAVGFEEFSTFAHQFENLLVRIKQSEVNVSANVVDILLASNDVLKTFIRTLKENKSAHIDTAAIVNRINSILAEKSAADNLAQIESIQQMKSKSTLLERPSKRILDNPSSEEEGGVKGKKNDDFIRLPIKKIEDLLNDFSEQVILQSSLEHYKDDIIKNADAIHRTIMQLNKITYELQQNSISLRMLSLKNIFNKMQRTVRDTAKFLNKTVRFVGVGEETELDKTMLDELSSPLTHIIRNSVDHGIESKEVRQKSGKPEYGTVKMSASYSGRYFYLIIEDDGGGLNLERIKKKAIQKGMLEEGRDVSEKELISFIFASGFSTNEVATDISGRGVGMDAIKKSIDKLHGTIEVKSVEGQGTKTVIKLPPTLAIFNGMVIVVDNKKYIMPSSEVLEIHHASLQDARSVRTGEKILKVKDAVYPIIELREVFHLPPKQKVAGNKNNDILFLVAHHDKNYLLHVDDILIQQRIVFKNLGAELEGLPAIAGGTILADGTVALILEVGDIVDLYKEALG
ncbi:MAG: hypothetical protein A2504_11290 [Bdellovibrionales bacterium RIFOXYD12_FULL_39_22]|nr:MAG: hypothetical protein A2385_09855 [Bdellovibrionales bacterium RIFOXYB1_FULL_39_21]OFZ44255.1 MAG: hypothetical protein A2485_07475 [Bdellovibrionales bacterium RIFOXYC12_FULL_39_17]OFZ46797.1 MAG: hypothetical protein A2404_04710 [Bdellovibrionales bacterium RIFOXYC1_FULL_39_130]OFZ69877.1 MAG: hypothetical protein A2451_01205 [Bdellovibrionales bacterium RIFOXYC2_FULL_39_8]OFZ75926.1 MAG: hypothetical protein A2560_02440 [Bdellovibrionales bacterium RIFOXYD1_FULL_39_84]OFZ95476.1 MAG: